MIVSHDGKPHDVTAQTSNGKRYVVTSMQAERVHIAEIQGFEIGPIDEGAGNSFLRTITVTNRNGTKTVLVLSSTNLESLTLNFSEAC